MLKGFKINTAIIICLAFLFRLFTLSTGFISSLDDKQNTHVKGYYALVTKKELNQVEPLNNYKTAYSELEFSEEDSDDDDELKVHASFLLESFCSPVHHNVIKQAAVISPSNKHFINSSLQRHLEFGIFRI